MKKICTNCKKEKDLEDFHNNCKAKDGKSSKCKECSIKHAIQYAKENKDTINARRRLKRKTDPVYKAKIAATKKKSYYGKILETMYYRAKAGSRQRGLEFNLEISDIIIPERCPILDVFLDKDRYYPSLDRIDNSKGYIKGNVRVISRVANRMKNDASNEELLAFSKNIKKYLDNKI